MLYALATRGKQPTSVPLPSRQFLHSDRPAEQGPSKDSDSKKTDPNAIARYFGLKPKKGGES